MVTRAIALLDALAESEDGLGVNELARRIDVNASTASRLLATLLEAGLVRRVNGGPYRLGLRLLTLSDRVLAQLDVRELARPLLAALVAQTGETATLSVPGQLEAVTVDFVPSPSSVVSMAWVGRPSVGHATAVGKVMLAFAPGHLGLRGNCRASPSAPSPTRGAGDRARRDPRARVCRGDRRTRARSRGGRGPVFARGGELVAILGLQGPSARLAAAARRTVREPLLAAAAQLIGLGRPLSGRRLRCAAPVASAPGIGAVRDRVQVAGGEALVAERVEQRGVLASEDPGDLRPTAIIL